MHQSFAVDEPFLTNREPNLASHLTLHAALPIAEPFFAEYPYAVACYICDFHLRAPHFFWRAIMRAGPHRRLCPEGRL